MPYILKEQRDLLENYELMPPEDGASLNFLICRLLERYTSYHGLSYNTVTDVRGAVMGALEEYTNIVINPYERIKRQINQPDNIWGDLPEQLLAMARSPLEDVEV